MTFGAEKPRSPDLLEPVRELLRDDEIVQEYLTSRWIGKAMLALRRARRQSGQSQAEVAKRMGTKQPSIARLEGDETGSMSLHRYAEYMAACGFTPFDVEFAESEHLRSFLMEDPGVSVLATRFRQWLALTLNNEEGVLPSTATPSSEGQENPTGIWVEKGIRPIVPFLGLVGEYSQVEASASSNASIDESPATSSEVSRSRQRLESTELVAA